MLLLPLIFWIGYIDWQSRRIPNYLVLILAGWAAVYAAFSTEINMQIVVMNIGIAIALTLPGYLKGIVGGGDVKLMLAISPLWPPIYLLNVFAIGIGSLILLMTMTYYVPKLSLPKASYPASKKITNPFERGIPLASAIALGALFMSIYTYILH